MILRKIRENIIHGYHSKCLCPAHEVTVREIYSHPETEVSTGMLLKILFSNSNFQKSVQLTNSIKKESYM